MSWTWRGKGYLCHSKTDSMNNAQNNYGLKKGSEYANRELTNKLLSNVTKSVMNKLSKNNYFNFLSVANDHDAEMIYVTDILPVIETAMTEEYYKLYETYPVSSSSDITASQKDKIADAIHNDLIKRRSRARR